MKKLALSFAMIVIASMTTSVFAVGNNPPEPECTKQKYPDLYTGAAQLGYETEPNGDKVGWIYQTVPFKNVKKTNAGYYFAVLHPVLYNECTEKTDYVPDGDMEALKRTFEALERIEKSKADAFIEKMDINIKIKYVNGKTDGVWLSAGIGYPSDLEIEDYK